MPVSNQKYALVTPEIWQDSLITRWPDAPLYGNHRLLVFTNEDLPKLEDEYSEVEFKYLSAADTIKAMESNEKPPFILNLNDAREVCKHFTPQDDDSI